MTLEKLLHLSLLHLSLLHHGPHRIITRTNSANIRKMHAGARGVESTGTRTLASRSLTLVPGGSATSAAGSFPPFPSPRTLRKTDKTGPCRIFRRARCHAPARPLTGDRGTVTGWPAGRAVSSLVPSPCSGLLPAPPTPTSGPRSGSVRCLGSLSPGPRLSLRCSLQGHLLQPFCRHPQFL